MRKFKIFQRALRRYTATGMYYSVAVPLAKEFTERVIVRYEKVIVSPPTNFLLVIQNCKFPCISATLPKPLVSPPTNF